VPTHPLKVAIAADGRPAYQIAGAAGVNPGVVSKIISGKVEPTEAVKRRLADELGGDVHQLFPEPIAL
jgi:transcriptional regulator with XRE-family HTH domain